MKFRLLFAQMTTNDTEVTLDERLGRAIAAWCWRRGVSGLRFGVDALGDRGFISRLARGRSVQLPTADRVLAFIGYPPLGPAFRLELDTYLAVSGTKISILGELALGDPSFVGRFRRGSSPQLTTVDRVRAWTAANANEEEVRAIRALLKEAAPALHPFARPEAEVEGMNGHAGDCLNEREAAARLCISPGVLGSCRARGEGPPFRRVGNRLRYLPADIDAWARAQRRTSLSEEKSARGRKER